MRKRLQEGNVVMQIHYVPFQACAHCREGFVTNKGTVLPLKFNNYFAVGDCMVSVKYQVHNLHHKIMERLK